MSEPHQPPIDLPEITRQYAHEKSAEDIILMAQMGIITCLADLMLRQKKKDMEAVGDLLVQRDVIRAKRVLLGYDPKESVRFVP